MALARSIYRSLSRNGWTGAHFIGLALLSALGALVAFDAWRDMFYIARRDEESSHAFLVPIVIGWLFWVRRGRARHCRPVGLWIGPIVCLLGWFLYSVGDTHLLQSLWHLGAILIVVGCCLSVLGTQVLRAFLPVFVALVFLVPVPGRIRQRIAIPLQRTTAAVTESAFRLADEPVTRSGNLLTINGVDVAVAEACNGMRMLFALGMVSYAFAFGTPLRGYARVLVLVATPVSAVLCNVIRLLPTVWVYGNYSADFARGFHDISGWVMLMVAFGLLMGVLQLLRWAMVPVAPFTLAYD
jgi:exosortase